jgi:pyruvate kinase
VGKPVALMADLQGPKIRVGKFADGKVMLENGQPFVLDAAHRAWATCTAWAWTTRNCRAT